MPDEVLGLIYAQTVVWVGSFFCPLLPLLNTAKFLLLFYLKKVRGGGGGAPPGVGDGGGTDGGMWLDAKVPDWILERRGLLQAWFLDVGGGGGGLGTPLLDPE